MGSESKEENRVLCKYVIQCKENDEEIGKFWGNSDGCFEIRGNNGM